MNLNNHINELATDIPLFSIIVPVFNSENYLHKCIDSLLAQTYADFELLLIDDGSTDRSGEICDEYAEKDLRIKVFHTSNKGVSTARNLGLSLARGKYINFVDSDDWVKPDYLEKYVDARVEYDYDIVFSEMFRVLDNGSQRVQPLKEFSARGKNDLSVAFAHLLEYNEFGYACNKSFKRELIISHNLSFNKLFKLYEDAVFAAHYCLYINSIKIIPSTLYYYRIVTTGLTKTGSNYENYHLATRTGCQALVALAKKQQSDLLYEAVGLFCQKWERAAILYMYLHGKNISRGERLNYLKEFQYRLFSQQQSVSEVKGLYKFVVIGMNLKNDKMLDLYFSLFSFIYRLKTCLCLISS